MLAEGAPQRGSRVKPFRATELGALLFRDEGWDPFLEDPGTLWLLHWQLVSRPARATTWWWVFNQYPGTVFTRGEIQEAIETLCAQRAWTRATSASLKRDIDVFIRTYAPQPRRNILLEDTLDCPLAELGVMRASDHQAFILVRSGHDSLPDEIFAYALADYLKRRPPGMQTVTLEDLSFGDGAPGRSFCLDEPGLLRRLDRIEALTGGGVVFDETAGLKQLYVHRLPEPAMMLQRYYDPQSAEARTQWTPPRNRRVS